MLTEQGVMKTEVIFSDCRTERYLLRKVWDEDKPLVSLIMTNPSSANVVTFDMTVHYCIYNLYKLDYGGVDILNMTSKISSKIDTKSNISLTETNVEQILKSAEKSDKVIIAWGKIGENIKKVKQVQLELLNKLKPHQDKLYMITSTSGESGFHPLASQIRFDWVLEKFVLPKYLKAKVEDDPKQPAQDKSGETSKNEPSEPTPSETSEDESAEPAPNETLKDEQGKIAKERKTRNVQSA